jgi:hypothetical protein
MTPCNFVDRCQHIGGNVWLHRLTLKNAGIWICSNFSVETSASIFDTEQCDSGFLLDVHFAIYQKTAMLIIIAMRM